MLRTFRYPLLPNKAQAATLDAWRIACQRLYNGALQHRRDAWRKQRVNVTMYDQYKELTTLRAADPEWAAVPVYVARSALTRLNCAFDAFFRRVKIGQTPGYPRFRSQDRYGSFDFGSNNPRIDGDHVLLPRIGAVKFRKYRDLRGKIKLVRIVRAVRGWYVSFVCDQGEAPRKISVQSATGIDVGLEVFATISNGERIGNPTFFKAGQTRLTRRRQSLARKKRGSYSRQRAKTLAARAYEHMRNQRLDFARKLACALFSRFDLIAHEDLHISGMVRGVLAKSIYDAAWGKFFAALALKAESAGKWCVPVDPRGTSQECSACGTVVEKLLEERQHRCSCGFVTHRDHNAALNIRARGLHAGQLTEVSRA